ncbi:hypothetical protein FRB90_002483 [Tulasnella sp. 427]|nr:hypothetical protein FRB90_002483 [Tulasnella sp. 427]
MFRSPSPAPSIAQSFESTAPSAWTNIDPLSSEGTESRVRRSKSLTPQDEHRHGGEVIYQPRVDSGAGMGIGTFNAGWGWSGMEGDSDDEDDDGYDSKTSRRNKGAGMFSRVFKSEAGPLNVSGQYKSGSSRGGHAWSDSTDLLHPYNTTSDLQPSASQSSFSHQHRSKTPPARPSSSPSMDSKSPPRTKKRGSKNRRPMSLNISMAGPAPPPPTFNNLPPETRADLLKKNRKLQQMLGPDYYNANAAVATHRSTASEDSNPISGLVAGMAGLGKKSASRKSMGPVESIVSSRPSHRPTSEYIAPGSQTITDFSSSHILINQGSTVDDAFSSSKKASTRLSKAKPASPKHVRPTHPAGSRSRSFSVATTPVSPVPPTPESFMDFSSDAGELFVASPSARKYLPAIGQLGSNEALPIFQLAAIPSSPGIKSATSQDPFNRHSYEVDQQLTDRSKTPRPNDIIVVGLSTPAGEDPSSSRPGRTLEKRVSMNSRSSSNPPASPIGHPGSSNHPYALSGRSHSVSSISTLETSLVPDDDAMERKRRRDRLVKLHRFLGSNVPAEAVLGADPPGAPALPAAATDVTAPESDDDSDDGIPKWWKGLKKTSSVRTVESGGPSRPESSYVVNQGPMTEQDRALNVRRKAKMQKMFGDHPPQGMYVSRSKAEEGEPSEEELEGEEQPPRPSGLNSLEFLRHSHSLNSLNYLVDKEDRESLRNLFNELTKQDPLSDLEEDIVFAPPEGLDDEDDDAELLDPRQPKRHTRPPFRSSNPPTISLNLPHSPLLSSSLASLSPTWRASPTSASPAGRLYSPVSPIVPSTLSKKPSESSFTSLDVDPVVVDGFQQRRKRAAKLTQFFGTDYRSLFGEVLESIESGVKDDQTKGTLTEEEAKELFRKLQRLRAKQDSFLPTGSTR